MCTYDRSVILAEVVNNILSLLANKNLGGKVFCVACFFVCMGFIAVSK